MSDAPDGVDPYWVEQGLPEACPECGERVNLSAHTDSEHREEGDGQINILAAEVNCDECGHAWDWERDSGEQL